MRRDHFYAGLGQFSVSLVGIVGIVANHALDRFFHKGFCERLLNQRYFMRRGAFRADGDRKTTSVSHCHYLGPLAALGLAHAEAWLYNWDEFWSSVFEETVTSIERRNFQ
jgi:hypothetical protein